jgi:rhodanese-related sulfurtransferase
MSSELIHKTDKNMRMRRKRIKRMNVSYLSVKVKKPNVTVVDVMDEEIHKRIHIINAINIPFTRLDYDAHRLLDPNNEIVTYSIDYECPVSRLAAEKLWDFGFRKVYYYPGGLKEWLEVQLPVVKSET